MAGRDRGEPVEQPFLPRDLGEQHHAEQKQINVRALGDAGERLRRRDQAQRDEKQRAGERPDRLVQIERAQDDARRGERGNGDDGGRGVRLNHDHLWECRYSAGLNTGAGAAGAWVCCRRGRVSRMPKKKTSALAMATPPRVRNAAL